jgi:hypothetical protein
MRSRSSGSAELGHIWVASTLKWCPGCCLVYDTPVLYET